MDALLEYSSDESDESDTETRGVLSEVKGSRTDFFGLQSTDISLSSQLDQRHIPNKTSVKHCDLARDKVQVDLPSTSFWKDVSADDVKILEQSANYVGRKVDDPQQIFKRKLQQTKLLAKKTPADCKDSQFNMKRPRNGCDSQPQHHNLEDEKPIKRKIFFVHPKEAPFLHSNPAKSKIPSIKEWNNPGHAGAVNRLKWNIPMYGHLLVSCSMDSTVKVWNIWSKLDPCLKILRMHSKAVRDVNWSTDGKQLLSCSYDKSAAVTDVETGTSIQRFEHTSYVTCCKYHPVYHHMCLTGSNNEVTVWDSRTPSIPCRTFTYKDNFGQVQDLLCTSDGTQLFSCSDLVSRDSADRNLMAWDFSTGTILSNQIYQERYTITRLVFHPRDNQLLAQSNGNYIAIFSHQRPYKMIKHKRFEGHKVEGYNIGFDISPDGQLVYSGSADGRLVTYSYLTGKTIQTTHTGLDVVMDVVCHPVLPSTVAVSGWDGTVQVWK